MADNVVTSNGIIAADELPYSGDAGAKIQIVQLGIVTGSEGSRSLEKIGGDVNGLKVAVNTSALPTGAATQATLADILTELGQKLEAGQAVALDSATLTALETITIGTALPAGEAHIGAAGGHRFSVRVEKTRPADTSGYANNDAIAESTSAGTVWTFAVGRVANGSGVITQAVLTTDDTTDVTRIEIDLYSSAPTAINDNAEATQLYVNDATYIDTITFPTLVKPTANSTLARARTLVDIPFVSDASGQIYGIVRKLDSDTPASGAKYSIRLRGIQD